MRPYLLCVVLLIGVSAYAATPAYDVIELQSMVPGSSTEPTGINASGDTVGTSVTADDRSNVAVIWTAAGNGVPVALSAQRSFAHSIRGSVAGGGLNFPDRNQAALFIVNGATVPLPDPFPPAGSGTPFTWVTAVIDGTTAAGNLQYLDNTSEIRAVVWSSSGTTILPNLGPMNASVTDANASGMVCGTALTPAVRFRGVVWQGGLIARVLLPRPGDPHSRAEGINASGDVVGSSGAFATLWPAGAVDAVTLPSLPGGTGEAYGINDSGKIVGVMRGIRNKAVLWTDPQTVIDLNALIPAGSGWDLQRAFAISNDGVIVGQGRLNGGRLTGFMLKPVRKTAIVVIPGIMGTNLFERTHTGDERIWYDFNKALLSPDDAYLNALELTPSGQSVADIHVDGLVDFIYLPLLSYLETQGYDFGVTLFTFPYDWRRSNEEQAQLLEQYILHGALPPSGANSVILVAHSMGGLIARRAALLNPGLIEKIIYVGTPQTGSAKSFTAISFDDELARNMSGAPLIDRVTLARLAATFPSTFQLLPRAPFVFSADEQRVLSLAETYSPSFLRSVRWVADADQFHANIAAPAQVPQVQIAGSGAATLGGLRMSHDRAGDRKWAGLVEDGDGTVTRSSATAAPAAQQTFFVDGVGHHLLPADACVHQLIAAVANGAAPPSCASSQPFPVPAGASWSTGSPVRVTVRDSADRVNEDIPGSRFWTLEHNEAGFLTAGAEYTFQIVAYETGVFSLTFRDGDATLREFADVPVAPGSRATLVWHAGRSASDLQIDIDGDGTADASFGVLSPETALDLMRRILAAIPLKQGTRNSLEAKLDAAAKALAKGNRNTAANVLQAMLHEIDAQTGKGIAEADARGLRITVQSVLERL